MQAHGLTFFPLPQYFSIARTIQRGFYYSHSPRRCFCTSGAMEPQTTSMPTTTTSVSHLHRDWQESLHLMLLFKSQNAVTFQVSNAEPLVMQIVVRRDLFDVSLRSADVTLWVAYARTDSLPKKEKWGVGPLMAQAAHAATAVHISHLCSHLFQQR